MEEDQIAVLRKHANDGKESKKKKKRDQTVESEEGRDNTSVLCLVA